MSNPFLPPKQGLYNPEFEHDSCGVGFIANIKGKKTHDIIRNGIKILENLTHRGACGCDPETGDGAGIMMQMPDAFLRRECQKKNIELPPEGEYGCGLVFLPPSLTDRNIIEEWTEHIIHEEGQKFLGWREVPHDSTKIGHVARSVEPEFKQLFIGRGKDTRPDELDRKLYVIRKRLYNKVQESTLNQKNYYYFCSLSTKTLVYKGQLMAEQVDRFFQICLMPRWFPRCRWCIPVFPLILFRRGLWRIRTAWSPIMGRSIHYAATLTGCTPGKSNSFPKPLAKTPRKFCRSLFRMAAIPQPLIMFSKCSS